MKDRTREAVMSLLGGTFPDAIAFDLFGGTGVLAFETVSRGASRAIVFEILKPASREIMTNAQTLGINDQVEVIASDVLAWSETLRSSAERFRISGEEIWVVFCCPPYAMWQSDGARLTELIRTWWDAAPMGSLFAVELDEGTPIALLPGTPECVETGLAPIEWDVRVYKPAQIATAEKL
jgi:16S rRNA G966 N2-methylase RsmD